MQVHQQSFGYIIKKSSEVAEFYHNSSRFLHQNGQAVEHYGQPIFLLVYDKLKHLLLNGRDSSERRTHNVICCLATKKINRKIISTIVIDVDEKMIGLDILAYAEDFFIIYPKDCWP
jgi:hypothetical protein